MLFLAEADVRALLPVAAAIPPVEAAFRKLALDEAENAPRQRVQTDAVMLHVLPAAAKTLGAIGLKAYTTGKFPAQFHVYLFDPKYGGLTAILEADYLGQARTGAASAVATNLLARPDASTVGVFGTGKQARTQLEAICAVRSITRAVVYGRDAERREAFARDLSAACQVEVVVTDNPEDAAKDQAIVVTATSARDPVLFGRWLAQGTHVNAVGSNFLAKAEVDTETVNRAAMLTIDSVDQGRLEAGDFLRAFRDGPKNWPDVVPLQRVVIGRVPGRTDAGQITLFKSLGLGIEDVAVAAKVVELARARGAGREIELE